MTDKDKQYLIEKRTQIVGNCPCKGSDIDCECWKRYRIEIAKVTSKIPSKYRDYTFEMIKHPDIQNEKKRVMDYVENLEGNYKAGTGLLLWGMSGTAKTALGNITLLHCLEKGYMSYYTDLSKCVTYLARGWYDEEVEANFIDKILDVDFLMIDNIGTEFRASSGLTESTLDSLFRERADKMLPVIITSNYNVDSLGNIYGKQMISLFREHLLEIEFRGADYRDVIGKGKEQHGRS